MDEIMAKDAQIDIGWSGNGFSTLGTGGTSYRWIVVSAMRIA
jgi:hypothetical protein